MKRSTIILFAFLALIVVLPVLIIKHFARITPMEDVEGIEASIKKGDNSVRYILIGENDSTALDIHITTVPSTGHPEQMQINGTPYEQDTLVLTSDVQGGINLVYEENLSLVIENHNRQATFYFEGASVEEMMILSSGDVNMADSNVGLIFVTDSLGLGKIHVDRCNIGMLVSSRFDKQYIYLNNSNIGRFCLNENVSDYTYKNCNIGMLMTGDKRVVIVDWKEGN